MIHDLIGMAAASLILATAAPEAPPTKAEAEAVLARLRTAATARDAASILAMVDDAFEVKTTLRLDPSERLFVHTRQELAEELPKLLALSSKPKVQTHLLSLTPADDAPAALMKYQWSMSIIRSGAESRIEATGGALLQRSANGGIVATRANQLIRKAGRAGGAKASGPDDSKNNTKIWESPRPKKKAAKEPEGVSAPSAPAPANP